jgi:hypothetical protein
VAPQRRPALEQPRVLVDFVFDAGALFVAIENYGDAPARDVAVEFSPAFTGAGGIRVSALPLFRALPFLAPRKRIATFLDASAAYFARGEPTRVVARITYRGEGRARHAVEIAHDLAVYRDVAYLLPRERPAVAEGISLAARGGGE